jgi:hypothetical protein
MNDEKYYNVMKTESILRQKLDWIFNYSFKISE